MPMSTYFYRKTLGLLGGLIIMALLCSARFRRADETSDLMFTTAKGPADFGEPVYSFRENPPTEAGFELGRKLFYDPILSGDYMTSCASCHQRFAAFAHVDHALSHGVLGKVGLRNVPALQNLAWSKSFMADGGILHLDLQPIAPITNPGEMNETLEHALQKLRSDSLYPRLFARAYGDTAVTSSRLLKALSQFLVQLVSANSRYDKMRRNEIQFSVEEQHGLEVFRARCVSCHAEPLFTDQSFRNINLPVDSALQDSGRARISGKAEDRYRFKVPSLRNVEWTYPYMHDGRFQKLAQVLDFYSAQAAEHPSEGTDAEVAKAAGLSIEEKAALLSFLKTLTDRDFLRNRRFADPGLR